MNLRADVKKSGGLSVILSQNGEVSLRVVAYGADLGGLLADADVTAVTALPDGVAVAGEDDASLLGPRT